MTVQVGLCQTWSETPKTGFLASRLNYKCCTRSGPRSELCTLKLGQDLENRKYRIRRGDDKGIIKMSEKKRVVIDVVSDIV